MRRTYELSLPDGRVLSLGGRTLVMGILNVTPDSFADGGLHVDPARAIEAGLAMVEAGADIVDVGGESTRPGAGEVPADEERRRVLPVLRGLARQVTVPLSVDTWKRQVAQAALDAGALIVNDISGLQYDPGLAGVVAETRAALVLMHTRGRPAVMSQHATYGDVVGEVAAELGTQLEMAERAGISREAVILDPGIGFAKGPEHSTALLARLDAPPLGALGRPWLVGPSRKSFLQAAIGDVPAPDRDWATAAAVTAAILHGAHIVRVHRVPEMVQVARVADMIKAGRAG
jgi:dihydropteroate synthase